MKLFYAYIRVSTVRQGEKGSSLAEQRDAINAFALRYNLTITAWFEEMETAAKLGRRDFSRMMSLLKHGKASGVIFHKIDRGARNLKDWSSIQDLIESGVDVRFAHESLDLNSRGGRLTADLLAVIAADYVRNLREEVRKGMQGRLKQGLYPLAAPLGYLDQGKGKPKAPDPLKAPYVRQAFELYASGRFNLPSLSDEMYRRGLRNRADRKLDVKRLSEMLRRPFYMGLIFMKGTGRTYPGVHQPIVSKPLFDRVQAMLRGKGNTKAFKHDFLFRRRIRCEHCNYALVGELKKGHVYYRCHTKDCPVTCLREEAIEEHIRAQFEAIALTEAELAGLREMVIALHADKAARGEAFGRALALQLQNLEARLSRLTDAYLDGAIDRSLFEEKKGSLFVERREMEEQRANIDVAAASATTDLLDFLELAKSLPLSYEMGNTDEKRSLLNSATSNLSADGKNVGIKLRSPFEELANRANFESSGPNRRTPRTGIAALFQTLLGVFEEKHKREKAAEDALAA